MKHMKKTGFGRSFRYFGRQAWMYAVYIPVFAFFMTLWMYLLSNHGSFQDRLEMIPQLTASGTFIILLTTNVTLGQSLYPVLASFGCLRRNFLAGSLLMNLLVIAISQTMFAASMHLFTDGKQMWVLPVTAAAYLVTAGLSQLMGIAGIRWGRTVYYVYIFFVGIICVAAGGMAAVAGDGEVILFDIDIRAMRYQILLAGAAVCALTTIAGYSILKKYEVKAG